MGCENLLQHFGILIAITCTVIVREKEQEKACIQKQEGQWAIDLSNKQA
jgi:hypothetical protein